MSVTSPYARRFLNRTSDPATGAEGQTYFNTSTNKLRIYSDGAWIDAGGSSFTGGDVASPITLPNGTAGSPSLGFSSDDDGAGTGLFRSSANAIGFTTNGTERWVINSSGALNPTSGNTYDIGGSTTIRDIGVGRNVVLNGATSGSVNLSASSTGGNFVVGNITFTNPASAITVVTPKKYIALLSQSSTNPPVATVLENSLGGTVVWTRNGAGDYAATLAGAFPSGKTVVFITHGDNLIGATSAFRGSDDTVTLVATEAAEPADGVLATASIMILVYP